MPSKYNYINTLRVILSIMVTISPKISCSPICEEAKRWLNESRRGMKTSNESETWNQLKFWISGNEENCLKFLLNGTEDETSTDKLYQILLKDVFKDEDEGMNKTGKNNCLPRGRKHRRRPNQKRGPSRNQNPGKNTKRNNPHPHGNSRNTTVPAGRPKNVS